MIEPYWDPTVPPEVREATEETLAKWSWVIPPWVQFFRVRWIPKMEDAVLEVSTSYHNRWAVLRIGPQWLTQPPEEREAALLHELVHIVLDPIHEALHQITTSTTEKNTPARRLTKALGTSALETATEDTARLLLNSRRAR